MTLLKTAICVILFAVSALHEQTAGRIATPNEVQQTGIITGSVFDPQGAVIPDATVVIQNALLKREVKTDENGEYRIELPAWTYQLTVEREDFCKYKKEGIRIERGEKRILDVELTPRPCNHRS